MPGLRQIYRRVAAAPMSHLVIGYSACMTLFFLGRYTSDPGPIPVFLAAGSFIAIIAQSLLITVVALYHDDDLLLAAAILVVLSGVGIIAGMSLAILIVTGSLGPAFVLAAGAPLMLFMRALIFFPLAVCLIWVLRRCRRFVAPDTLGEQGSEASAP
jgi:hypothetical protein